MIIGLSGYAQSGKDTVAGLMIGLHGYERVAFADKIKELLFNMDPDLPGGLSLVLTVEDYGWDKTKQIREVRRLLQTLGVGARKVFGEDFWVQQALSGIHGSDKIVVTDVRFPNEAQFINDLGGQVWRVQRPGVEAVNAHPSESALDEYIFDEVILNDFSLDSLKIKVKGLLS